MGWDIWGEARILFEITTDKVVIPAGVTRKDYAAFVKDTTEFRIIPNYNYGYSSEEESDDEQPQKKQKTDDEEEEDEEEDEEQEPQLITFVLQGLYQNS